MGDALICIIGDSLMASRDNWGYKVLGVTNTAGVYADSNQRYAWRQVYESGGSRTICCNYALSGSRLTDFTGAWLSETDELAVNRGRNRYHLLVIAWGTNPGHATSAEHITALQSMIAARKAAGWDDVILPTLVSRTDGVIANFNSTWAHPINQTLRDSSWRSTHGVYHADIAASELVGPWNLNTNAVTTASDNVTYFVDKIHPTTTTVNLVTPILQTAINARLTARGCPTLPAP